ncbi:MAG: hypothetical protein ACJ8EQ_01480 [Sphingomicrobium sp.]
MGREIAYLSALVVAPLVVTCGASRASAQQCSRASSGAAAPSQVQTLEGRLVYRNDIRQWFELKLDKPTCGESSIQLVPANGQWERLEILRGCRVNVTGQIDYSPTGYYSRELYQDASRVRPVGRCVKQPRLPDYSKARPAKNVRAYRVEMQVDYRPGDHPIAFHVRSGRRELRPWQAYATYTLTGSFVLYGQCAEGFVVARVWGTKSARPGHFTERGSSDDMATFDPESAAELGVHNLLHPAT